MSLPAKSSEDTTEVNKEVFHVVIALFGVILCIILCLGPIARCCNDMRNRSTEREETRERKKELKMRISKSLITKKVLRHGLSREPSASNEENVDSNNEDYISSNIDNEDQLEKGGINEDDEAVSVIYDASTICSICLERFKVGEEVSWSKKGKCDHVFHHECISPWLLKNENCPCCRGQYLLDSSEVCNSDETAGFDQSQRRQRTNIFWALMMHAKSSQTHPDLLKKKEEEHIEMIYSRCRFCVDHGLIFPGRVEDDEGIRKAKISYLEIQQ